MHPASPRVLSEPPLSLSALFRIVNGLLLALVLVVLWRFAGQEWSEYRRAQEGARALIHLQQALKVGETVAAEYAPSRAVMAQGASRSAATTLNLTQARQRTDQALADMNETRASEDEPARQLIVGNALSRVQLVVDEVRRSVDAVNRPASSPRGGDALSESARLQEAVAQMVPLMDGYTALAMQSYPERFAAIQGAQLVAALHNEANLLATQLRPAMVALRGLTDDEREAIGRTRGRISLLGELLERQLEQLDEWPDLNNATRMVRRGYLDRAQTLVQQVVNAGMVGAGHYPVTAMSFVERYDADVSALLILRDVLIQDAVHHAEQRSRQAEGTMLLASALLSLMALGLAGTMWLLHHRVFRPLSDAARAIHQMAAGSHEVAMPQVPSGDEIGAVVGALQKLQGSQRQAARLGLERDALIQKLRSLSSTDPLTGLLNRRAFFEAAERELSNAERHGFEVAVLLLDLDHFKAINDTHGHAVGDKALVAVANALQGAVRQGDVLGRYGGEEFVLMLPHCGRHPGQGFAERLRHSVADLNLLNETGGAFSITVSLGVASSGDVGLNLATLLNQADAAMYRAKHLGRNRVICLQDEPTESLQPSTDSPFVAHDVTLDDMHENAPNDQPGNPAASAA